MRWELRDETKAHEIESSKRRVSIDHKRVYWLKSSCLNSKDGFNLDFCSFDTVVRGWCTCNVKRCLLIPQNDVSLSDTWRWWQFIRDEEGRFRATYVPFPEFVLPQAFLHCPVDEMTIPNGCDAIEIWMLVCWGIVSWRKFCWTADDEDRDGTTLCIKGCYKSIACALELERT